MISKADESIALARRSIPGPKGCRAVGMLARPPASARWGSLKCPSRPNRRSDDFLNDIWISSSLRQPFAIVATAGGCDPKVVTPNCLRHSSIVRQLINAVPIRVVAAHHDTSIRMIERTYSKHISDHSEARVRRALLDAVLDNRFPGAAA